MRVAALLDTQSTLVLSTAGSDGMPASAPLFFAYDAKPALYWLSSPGSLHSRNLTARPEAAVSVFAPVMDWQAIRGVQMTGVCAASINDGALASYRRRFALGPEFDSIIASSTLYRFTPKWLRYLDNSLGFGFRTELDLA